MKALTILVTSALVSGIIMTSAQAMGRKGDPEFTHFVMKMTDANADGMVSKDEFMKMSAKMAEKEFMMMDMDGDGMVSDIEFKMHNR